MSFVLPSQEDHVLLRMHAWARGQLCIFMNFACFLLYWIYMPWIFAANKNALSNDKVTSNFATTLTAVKARGAHAPLSRWQDHLPSSLLNMQRTRICVLHHRLTLKGHVLVYFIARLRYQCVVCIDYIYLYVYLYVMSSIWNYFLGCCIIALFEPCMSGSCAYHNQWLNWFCEAGGGLT